MLILIREPKLLKNMSLKFLYITIFLPDLLIINGLFDVRVCFFSDVVHKTHAVLVHRRKLASFPLLIAGSLAFRIHIFVIYWQRFQVLIDIVADNLIEYRLLLDLVLPFGLTETIACCLYLSSARQNFSGFEAIGLFDDCVDFGTEELFVPLG